MKAIVLHRAGPPEVLSYEDVPTPQPARGEVLVKVKVASVNNIDVRTRKGTSGQPDALPVVLGRECVGEVVELGENVQGIPIGLRALVYHWRFCGTCEHCLAGNENLCVSDPLKRGRRDVGLLGSNIAGSYAEYMVAPARCLVPIPDGLTYEDACALGVVASTAWHMLMERAKLRPAETALILAAGSGIGSAAIQIARLAGARVIATTGSPAKMEKARELGADFVINYAEQDFSQKVMQVTAGRGADVVFETTGAATFAQSMASLAVGGRIVVGGKHTGSKVTFDLLGSMPRDWQILDSCSFTRRDVLTVYNLALKGKMRPVIYAKLPLKEAAEGHRILEERRQFGKVLLLPEA